MNPGTTVRELERIYSYHYWANDRLFGAIERLTPEEFTRPVAGSWSSVRNTLVHILSAEWGWLERCGGRERGGRLVPDDFPTVESVRAAATSIEGFVREHLASLSDEDLRQEIQYVIEGVAEGTKSVGELLHHAAIHGIHHRGQVALLLRELGHVPGNFDYLFYPGT